MYSLAVDHVYIGNSLAMSIDLLIKHVTLTQQPPGQGCVPFILGSSAQKCACSCLQGLVDRVPCFGSPVFPPVCLVISRKACFSFGNLIH